MTYYDRLVEAVTAVVKATKKKTDLPAAIADAVVDMQAEMFSEDVTLYVADPKLSPTHIETVEHGVRIEYRAPLGAISYEFPAGSVVALEAH